MVDPTTPGSDTLVLKLRGGQDGVKKAEVVGVEGVEGSAPGPQ
jgi:hypothetical protein